jgi:trimeric autotransporter adhesin
MTRTRFVFLSIFALSIGACGGRNGLHLQVEDADGGLSIDGGRVNGKASDGGSTFSPEVAHLDGGIVNADGPGGTIGIDGRGFGNADGPGGFGNTDGRGFGNTETGGFGNTETGRPPVDAPTDATTPGNPDGRPGDAGPPDGRLVPDGRGGPPTNPDAAATLSSIEISPSGALTVNVGTPLTLTITAVYSDDTTKDVSSTATVESANTSILTVSGTTLTGLGTSVANTTITASFGGKSVTATVTVNGTNPLASIGISGVPTSSLAVGATVTLVATGVFTDGTKQDVTANATWASSNSSVCTVGSTTATKGIVTGVAAGTCTATATIGSITGTSSTITVESKALVSIAITPSTPTLQRGLTNQPFTATGTYDDNTTADVTQGATWSSSDTTVLTVIASGKTAGNVTTVSAGQATITATVGSISGTDVVTVTEARLRGITVSGASVLVVGSPKYYTATGTYTDGTTSDLTSSVTWSSSDTKALTVSNAAATVGLASGVAAGSATLSAKLGNVTGQLKVTVSAAPLISITVTPATVSDLIVGLTSSLKATGLYGDSTDANTQFSVDVTSSVTWTTSNATYATVSNASDTAGQVTGVAAGGPVTITAALSGKTAIASVTVLSATLSSIKVSPSTASVRTGSTYPFTATGTFSNGTVTDITSSVTWSSSATSVASVSNASGTNGVATGVSASSTAVTITATMSGVSSTASLTVTEATVKSIQISPSATQSITAGSTQNYTVTAVYENGTTATLQSGVTWSSSNTAVATVAATTAGGGGFPGGGGGTPGGGETATGVAAGSTTIKASYTNSAGTTFTDSVTLVVKAVATISGIRMTPITASVKVGETQTYTVYADYSDGTSATLNSGVTLTSSNGDVASVSSGGGGGGIPGGGGGGGTLSATGLAVSSGAVTITASYTSSGTTHTATSSLTVTSATTVTGLYLTPTAASVTVNGTQQFRAYTTNSDGTTTDVTSSSSTAWTTSDGTYATITSGAAGGGRGAIFSQGGGGLATGLVATSSDVTISAVYTPSDGSSAVSATAKLTVTAAKTPSKLTVSPASATILLNGTQAFSATLIYTDGSTSNVTSAASWGTTDPSVVVMSNANTGMQGGGGGVGVVGGATATGVGTGNATVTASYTVGSTAYTASASVEVSAFTVKSFTITPTNPTIYYSSTTTTTEQFTATLVVTTDGTNYTSKDVTSASSWTSDKSSVAVIGGSTGRATAMGTGSATISATYIDSNGTSHTASDTLTVSTRTLSTLSLSPTTPTTHVGFTKAFTVYAIYNDGTKSNVTSSASWSSGTPTVATITTGGGGPGGGGGNTAVATALTAGSTDISATYGGITKSTTLKVGSGTLSSIAVTATSLTVPVGVTEQLTATGTFSDNLTEDLTSSTVWLSSNDSNAAVSNATGSVGLLTAVAASSSAITITAEYGGVSGTASFTITAN